VIPFLVFFWLFF